MIYSTERQMSKDFEKYLKANWGGTYYKECQGLFGVPDYVCFYKHDKIEIIAFELKLTDWQQAINQCFRYKSFADLTYVVLPEDVALRVAVHLDDFKQYGIGLVAFCKDTFNILYKPMQNNPYSPDLRFKMEKKVKLSRKRQLEEVCVAFN